MTPIHWLILTLSGICAAMVAVFHKYYYRPPQDEPITPNLTPPMPIEQPVNSPVAQSGSSMIQRWANAIAAGEGANPASNNPGNLKYSTLTASWGATKGNAASDGGYLCHFATQDIGTRALCNFLTLGCENELIAFHSPAARTLEGFTEIYAGNPPQGYINKIVATLGVPANTQISTFLIPTHA